MDPCQGWPPWPWWWPKGYKCSQTPVPIWVNYCLPVPITVNLLFTSGSLSGVATMTYDQKGLIVATPPFQTGLIIVYQCQLGLIYHLPVDPCQGQPSWPWWSPKGVTCSHNPGLIRVSYCLPVYPCQGQLPWPWWSPKGVNCSHTPVPIRVNFIFTSGPCEGRPPWLWWWPKGVNFIHTPVPIRVNLLFTSGSLSGAATMTLVITSTLMTNLRVAPAPKKQYKKFELKYFLYIFISLQNHTEGCFWALPPPPPFLLFWFFNSLYVHTLCERISTAPTLKQEHSCYLCMYVLTKAKLLNSSDM